MKIEITNNITGETTLADVPDMPVMDLPSEPQMPSEADRISALESAMLDMILGGV